jgi:hypothetical protein
MAVNPIKTPFTNMSFTPDVPSSSLSANEYNQGRNIETNVRGINSVAGDEYILSQIPGHIIFVTSGFRGDIFWFIVATSEGNWYAIDEAGYTNISVGAIGYNSSGYGPDTVITASWNGEVLFINDELNPPMYLLPPPATNYNTLRLYDNAPDNYVWNYNTAYDAYGNIIPEYSNLTAAFLRVYNSPNLGSLLVAGNLTGDINANVVPGGGTTQNLPTTIRWSQNFGLNSGPTTWAPTLTNTANELEVPVRGAVIDAFPLNGNFYIASYWDICVMSPISYQSSTVPVFGIKLVNQGRGLLNENCWSNVDNTVFGLDARDVWSFDGGNFKAIGNQRVKDYLINNINADYTNQVFMIHNSSKYQIEIYYPDLTSTGRCNQMMSYRYDLDAWNPPRQVTNATQACESPIWTNGVANLATRGVVYSSGTGNVALVQKDQGTSFLGNTTIPTLFQRNNISFGQPYSASVQVHRMLPEIYGTGNVIITVGGSDSVASNVTYRPPVEMPIVTNNPWVQIDQNEARVNTIKVESNTATTSWQMTAANWQVTIVQETR